MAQKNLAEMLRTAVNITGDAACATIVDRFRDSKATEMEPALHH